MIVVGWYAAKGGTRFMVGGRAKWNVRGMRLRHAPFTFTGAMFLCLVVLGTALMSQRGAAQIINDPSYQALWDRGEYHQALARLQEEIDKRPELKRTRAFRYVNWVSDRANLRALVGDIDGAIEDLEWITGWIEEPAFYIRLANLYQTRGRLADYRRALENTVSSAERRYGFHSREENLLALCQAYEHQGENPKQLLSSWYSILTENYPNFTKAFVSAGDLCRRHRAYDLAEGYYQQALDKNPDSQGALEGLALTYWQSDDPRLGEIITKLMERNPNSFIGLALQAEKRLDNNDPEKALEIVNQGLKVNPHHLRLRGLKAAAYFLMDQHEKMERAQEKVLQFNPHASIVFRIPGRVASRHYRFKQSVELQRQAVQIDPEDHEARALLGLDLLRLGREEQGRLELETAFEQDPYNVHVYNMLELLDSIDKFVKVEEGPFVLQLPKEERQVLIHDALSLLNEALTRYQDKYAIQLETPISVQIFDDHDDFMVRSLGLPGMVGFLGICFGQLVTMDSPSARPLGTMNWRSVLWHEFVHVITLQKTNNRMPRWLSEGISVYEETQRNPAWGQKMDVKFKPVFDNEPLPGLEQMELYFTQPKTSLHLMIGYFLAGEFVHFYTEEYGIEALKEALSRIGNGGEANQALVTASGLSLEDLNHSLKNYLRQRLAPYDHLPEMELPDEQPSIMERIFNTDEDPKPWLERPSPFTDALRAGRQALQAQNYETAESELKKAYELFPDYEGPDRPLMLLAQLYQARGQREKLKEILWKEIHSNDTAFESGKRLAQLTEEDQAWDKVVYVTHRAMGVNPFDIELRRQHLDALMKSGQFHKALTATEQLAHLDRARQTRYRLQSIDLLMEMDDWNRAKQEAVTLLEEFPHYWQAQQRLLKIVETNP